MICPKCKKDYPQNKERVLETFLKQQDYLKREQINKIELAKKEETKANRIQKLISELGGTSKSI